MLSRYVQIPGFSSDLNWPTPKSLPQKAKNKKPYDEIFLSKWVSRLNNGSEAPKSLWKKIFLHKPPFLQQGRVGRHFLDKEDFFFHKTVRCVIISSQSEHTY